MHCPLDKTRSEQVFLLLSFCHQSWSRTTLERNERCACKCFVLTAMIQKSTTRVYTFRSLIRWKQLGNWPNTYAKRLPKTAKRTLAKRRVGETTINRRKKSKIHNFENSHNIVYAMQSTNLALIYKAMFTSQSFSLSTMPINLYRPSIRIFQGIWTEKQKREKPDKQKNYRTHSLLKQKCLRWKHCHYIFNTYIAKGICTSAICIVIIKDSRGILGTSFRLADVGNSWKHPKWRPERGDNWQLKKTLNWKPEAWFYGIVYDVCVYEDLWRILDPV